jgi:isocitrate/isopropylmalate dehydrogenase
LFSIIGTNGFNHVLPDGSDQLQKRAFVSKRVAEKFSHHFDFKTSHWRLRDRRTGSVPDKTLDDANAPTRFFSALSADPNGQPTHRRPRWAAGLRKGLNYANLRPVKPHPLLDISHCPERLRRDLPLCELTAAVFRSTESQLQNGSRNARTHGYHDHDLALYRVAAWRTATSGYERRQSQRLNWSRGDAATETANRSQM